MTPKTRRRAIPVKAVIKPIDAYARIQYQCLKCDELFMGSDKHVCKKAKKQSKSQRGEG